jgi:hypothetical protein
MFTLNDMLIFFFERHAVGEYPTVVLYKHIKNIKIKNKIEASISAAELYNRLYIHPNRNAMASLNLNIIFQLKMLFSQTDILILFYTSLNLKIIFQLKSEAHYSILK